jgi:hypothetical protein
MRMEFGIPGASLAVVKDDKIILLSTTLLKPA